jgi:flagellar basal body-associated protein FliL
MSKANSQDNFVAYIAAVVVALAGIFIFAWSHLNVSFTNPAKPQIAYAQFGPLDVETQNFTLTTSLAVQTSTGDAEWTIRNRALLNVIFKKILADTDANTVKAPNGMQILQDALRKGANAAMGTQNVQAVLLTGFSFKARDR